MANSVENSQFPALTWGEMVASNPRAAAFQNGDVHPEEYRSHLIPERGPRASQAELIAASRLIGGMAVPPLVELAS